MPTINQVLSNELAYESGAELSSPPDTRAFNDGSRIYSKDAFDRPVLAEGWISHQPGQKTNKAVRDVISGLFTSELNVSHLFPRAFGGALGGNVTAFSAVGNNAMSAFESKLSRMAKSEELYIQAYAHYSGEVEKIPYAMELKVYRRDGSGAPEFVDACRVDFEGKRDWYH